MSTAPTKRTYFPKVKEAREALRDEAVNILQQYLAVVKAASADGDYEVATKSLQWLMEHMPEDEGTRMLATNVDKQAVEKGSSAPVIQIGIALGGQQKQLPAPTITAIDLEDVDSI